MFPPMKGVVVKKGMAACPTAEIYPLTLIASATPDNEYYTNIAWVVFSVISYHF